MVRRWILLGLGLFPFALAHYASPLPDSQIAPPVRQFGLP
ncbi:MAG: peptidase M23, partial [Meiothermus sp.]